MNWSPAPGYFAFKQHITVREMLIFIFSKLFFMISMQFFRLISLLISCGQKTVCFSTGKKWQVSHWNISLKHFYMIAFLVIYFLVIQRNLICWNDEQVSWLFWDWRGNCLLKLSFFFFFLYSYWFGPHNWLEIKPNLKSI